MQLQKRRHMRMDRDEFITRVEGMRSMLYCIGCMQFDEPAERKDAIQEAIFKTWEKRYSLQELQYFNTWFARILANECHNSVAHSCYVQEGVPDLLDRFDADELLEGVPGVPEDLVENLDRKIKFTITLAMKNAPGRPVQAVMEDIGEFISFYGFAGDMFAPDPCEQRRRRANELIFVYAAR